MTMNHTRPKFRPLRENDLQRVVGGVALYDEFSLGAPPPGPSAGTPACITELGARLLSCAGPGEMQALLDEEIAEVGFDGLEYSEMAWTGDAFHALDCLDSHAPQGWLETYCRQQLWRVDTRLRMRLVTGVPATWSVQRHMAQEEARPQPRPQALAFLDRLAQAGVGSGMTLVLPAAGPGRATVMHWLSRATDIDAAEKRRLSQALVMGLGLHECLSHLRHPPVAKSALVGGLTPQQSCIAECLAKGMSDKGIARALSLSTHAVDYHLRVLRSKFKVNNRVQLAKALGASAAVFHGG